MDTCQTVIKKTGKICGRTKCGYHKPAVVAPEPVVSKPEPVVSKPEPVVEQLTESIEKLTVSALAGCDGEITEEIIAKGHKGLRELKETSTGQFYIKDMYTNSVYSVSDDDDCIDIRINGEQYAVTTRRGLLYRCSDDYGDVLVGFSGFGKYETIIPENGKWKSNYTI
jgi:hypothetical protein